MFTIHNFLKGISQKYGLSSEEEEVFIALFSEGKEQKQVEQELNLSRSTLTGRLERIYRKFRIGGSGPGKAARLYHFLLQETIKMYGSLNSASLSRLQDVEESISAHSNEAINEETLSSTKLINMVDSLYIERPPIEFRCYEVALQPGTLIRIKAPRQRGKTLLLKNILNYTQSQECRTAYLNLLQPEEGIVQNLDTFLRWFCHALGQQLEQVHSFDWDGDFGSNSNCTRYLKNCLLEKDDRPLVLALDNVDRLFPHAEIAQEFFGLLRSWRENAQVIQQWAKLRLIVAHAAEVYVPLDFKRSPFNVGLPIQLPEFTEVQVAEMSERLRVPLSEVEISQLTEKVGGHPWMVHQALSVLKSDPNVTLDYLLQAASTEAGLYNSHLRGLWSTLEPHSDLVDAIKQLVSSSNPVPLTSEVAYQLESLGIIRREGNNVAIFCDIYSQYFLYRLGKV